MHHFDLSYILNSEICAIIILTSDTIGSVLLSVRPWKVRLLLDACSIKKNDYQVAVLALDSKSPRVVPNMSVYGPDHYFQDQWLGVERCYFIFLHPAVGVSRSVWCFLCMEIGVLYLSHATWVLAELIVCSTRGFACIPGK